MAALEEKPLVDVGMPAHGEPIFLAESVKSVLRQSHHGLRLLVLDDSGGSQIERVMQPFLADERVDYRQVEAMSATEVMTVLMQAGSAPLFAFLHDDDLWEAGFLERRVEFLERHPECGLVFSGHVDIDDEGRETARFPAPYPEGVVSRGLIVPEMQRRNVIDVMHCALTKRSALEAAGPRLDSDFPRVFDWELWLRVVLRFPVGCVEAEDAQYRAHDAQMSSRPGRAHDFREMMEHADRLTVEFAPDLRLDERERRRKLAQIELSEVLDALQEGESKAARRALRGALRVDARTALRDSRFLPALLGAAGGAPARAAVSRLRDARWRRLQARRSSS